MPKHPDTSMSRCRHQSVSQSVSPVPGCSGRRRERMPKLQLSGNSLGSLAVLATKRLALSLGPQVDLDLELGQVLIRTWLHGKEAPGYLARHAEAVAVEGSSGLSPLEVHGEVVADAVARVVAGLQTSWARARHVKSGFL